MDRLCLDAGALGQALCGTTGRGTERDPDGLREKDFEDRVDQSRLSDTRTAGDYEHLGSERDTNSLSLALGKHQLRPLLDPRNGLVDINGGPGRLSGAERLQLLGDFALGSVKCSKEDATAAFEIVGNDGTTLEFEVRRRLHQFGRHFEQLFGEGNELFDRKTAMPFIHRLGERIGDPGADADQRCLLDAELGRDLIGRSEADPRMSRASR